MPLRFFIQTLEPIPGTNAQPVHYPACEWVSVDGSVNQQHPLNRFVCSWLTSDMSELHRCDEVLHVMTQIDAATRQEWFVDGDAFNVDMHINGVQFNQTNIGSEHAVYWNQSEASFGLKEVSTLLSMWRQYLADFLPVN